MRGIQKILSRSFYRSSGAHSTKRLVEIGRFEDKKLYECYPSGQFFVHRIFGYRGVILFHWVSRLYDRDKQEVKLNSTQWEEDGKLAENIKNLKMEKQTYYQVLIDQRDYPQIRALPEAITLTADRNDKSLYSISGLDYVSHEDILPYNPSYKSHIYHELFHQFFVPSGNDNDPPYSSREVLSSWHEKNICWLEHVEIHRETTRNIRVTIMPFYMGSRDSQQTDDIYWWRYCIRLENLGGTQVQLRHRHWRIYGSSGLLETKGDGVIGQQPVLSVRQPAFQYSSHVSLPSHNGHMWGTFQLEREDGKFFRVRVPPFVLTTYDY